MSHFQAASPCEYYDKNNAFIFLFISNLFNTAFQENSMTFSLKVLKASWHFFLKTRMKAINANSVTKKRQKC